MSRDYGPAKYFLSRLKKNKVIMWESRVHPGRMYEYVVSCVHKCEGLVTYRCYHCSNLRKSMLSKGFRINSKCPIILVDRDIIKEDPDRPNNGSHICRGKDIFDFVLQRCTYMYLEKLNSMSISDLQNLNVIDAFQIPKEVTDSLAITITPVQIQAIERKLFTQHATFLKYIISRKLSNPDKELPASFEESIDLAIPNLKRKTKMTNDISTKLRKPELVSVSRPESKQSKDGDNQGSEAGIGEIIMGDKQQVAFDIVL